MVDFDRSLLPSAFLRVFPIAPLDRSREEAQRWVNRLFGDVTPTQRLREQHRAVEAAAWVRRLFGDDANPLRD